MLASATKNCRAKRIGRRGCNLHGQARLAASAGPRQRQQMYTGVGEPRGDGA